MNITILGAGAMGSLFGGLLAEAGSSVTLLDVNQRHLDAIRSDGLRVETDRTASGGPGPDSPRAGGARPGGPGAGDASATEGAVQRVIHLAACRPEEASQIPDLLMIFTKTYQIGTALTAARHLLGPGTWVLTLQNGLGNVEAISAFVPLERILVGVTTIPADYIGPGMVRSHGGGQVRMAAADPTAAPICDNCMLATVVDLLAGAGLQCAADPYVWAAIWEKVSFNAAFNALCAVTGCTVEQIELVPSGPATALAVVAEVIAVAHASGVHASLARVESMVRDSFKTHAGHQPSMLQDVLAHRRTEIDSINGAVVRAAAQHRIPVPNTAMLYTLVRLIEERQLQSAAGPAALHREELVASL